MKPKKMPTNQEQRKSSIEHESLFTRRRILWTVIVLMLFIGLTIFGAVGVRGGWLVLPTSPQAVSAS